MRELDRIVAPEPEPYTTITACRACGGTGLEPVLDLGCTPLADALVTFPQIGLPEYSVPLDVVFCPACSLVQIRQTVAPEILFCRSYPYYSSVSPALMRHFESSAVALIDELSLTSDHLVVEAASNDGYMLRVFRDRGIPVLGIDPADGPAERARAAGIETLGTFFTADVARGLRDDGRRADLFLANNVLAHVADLNGFVDGIATVLAPNGVAVIECPYVLDLIEGCEFDTIYHQHLCFFSVHALDRLFRDHGLTLNRVDRTAIHGGSLRLYVSPNGEPDSSVASVLAAESAAGATSFDFYRGFAERVERLKSDVMALVRGVKADGKRIAGYGAAAKATTLLAYLGIDRTILDYVVDLNAFKVGRYMGGTHLPIVAPERLHEDPPDYLLILAWNFADEIIAQQAAYAAAGGRFIVPIPHLRVI